MSIYNVKKKRSLKARLANPISRTWRNKADHAWVKALNSIDNKCAICGSTENQLQAHHLIPREILQYRHVRENGILLCVGCHKYSVNFSAHRNCMAFAVWLQQNRPWQWEWVVNAIANTVYPTPLEMLDYQRSYQLNILLTPPPESKDGKMRNMRKQQIKHTDSTTKGPGDSPDKIYESPQSEADSTILIKGTGSEVGI